MRRLLLICFSAILSMAVIAQTARKFTVNISPDGKANMVAYLPDSPTGRAVVACPGGGYTHLAIDHEGHDWAAFFNSRGIAYFVLTYRMPKGDRSIPVGDAETAIRTVRDSAKVWRVNPYDVGIMGFSAGGHLASTVSTHSEYAVRPNFSILFYPVISMNERESHKGSCVNFLGADGQKNEKLVKEFSNQNAVRRHLTPPAIILTADDDRAVPPVTNAIAYYSAMRRSGNGCALHVYPSGGHGFGYRSTFKYHDQMLSDLSSWLQNLKAPRKDAVRVACVGNSITDGHGIDLAPQRGYPALLQQMLGDGYQVKNCGLSGRTMLNKGDQPYMRERAWRDALAFHPDVVVVKLGTNDSKAVNWQYGNEFESDLMQMINQLRPNHPRIMLCTPIKALKPSWGISDSVITTQIIPIIKRVAQREGFEVIDLHSLFDANDKTVMNDGIHPTEEGCRRMAEIIFAAIRKE